MYGRIRRIQIPPGAVDKAIAFCKENVVPTARSASGNAGAILLVDRKNGVAVGITLWETTQALNAESWNGTERRRRFRLEGDRLFVESAPAPSLTFPGTIDYRQIVWEREPG